MPPTEDDKKRMRQELANEFRRRAWVIENDDATWEKLSGEAFSAVDQYIRSRFRNVSILGALMVVALSALATLDYRQGDNMFGAAAMGAAALFNLYLFYRNLNSWANFNKNLSSSGKIHKSK